MRPEAWESLLFHHILEARGKPFEWGTHDCVLDCALWIEKITGADPAAGFRGTYKTEAEAAAVIESLGFATAADLASSVLEEKPVPTAQRGDIVLHPCGTLGICDGAHAYFVTHAGMLRVEFLKCLKAWKV
jgi:hypothetical protein